MQRANIMCKLLILEFCFHRRYLQPRRTAHVWCAPCLRGNQCRSCLSFSAAGRYINPAGELAAYSEAVSTFIAHGIRHIFGTITSASRKEIILDLEQHNLLLWYGCPYEGSESCEQVVYLGGCPNQTLLPLLRLALDMFGNRPG